MADFSFLSDTEDSAVEELLSQAKDLCVLEQVSAINCSGFVDSILPTELESRFSRLKSFPATNSNPKSSLPNPHSSSARYSSAFTSKIEGKKKSDSLSDDDSSVFSPSKQNPDDKLGERAFTPRKENSGRKKGSKPESKRRSVSFSSDSSDSSPDNAKFSTSKRNPEEKKRNKSKLRAGSLFSPLGSCNSSKKSPSPPKKSGCFWCSPKKGSSRRKSKENWEIDSDLDWSKHDELLSDLGSFSIKEQHKILKKAMKEQQKISREARKIVKMAKQASARMSSPAIEDELELSDD
ncbi:hypothetical protein UlMin_000963 [Ulmus minor]